MASGDTGNVVPGNRLRVRVPCPPLDCDLEFGDFRADACTHLHPLVAIGQELSWFQPFPGRKS